MNLKGDKKADASPTWTIETPPEDGLLLCGHPGSPNVVAVSLFASKFLGDKKYKFQTCDIMKGEQMSPDYLAINPFHQVPAGKMSDGTGLFESGSMLRYLAQKFSPELYPADKQFLIDACMDKRQTDFYSAWKPIAYYSMQIGPQPDAGAGKKMTELLSVMAKAFLTGKFVAGDTLTIADYSLVPLINTLSLPTTKKVGYTLPERWAKYLDDFKNAHGDTWGACTATHENWLASKMDDVKAVVFDPCFTEAAGSGTWAIETPPEDGLLLCGHPGSANVVAVSLFASKVLGDKKYKFQTCDIMKGEQMSPDYLAINPFHQVPAGKMSDGTGLFESGSMLRYLAQKFSPELYPADKQFLIDACMDKRQTDFYSAWKPIAYYSMQIGPKPDAAAGKTMTELLSVMAKAFLAGKFVAGDTLTIADYSLVPLINTLSLPTTKKVGYTLPERWAKYLDDFKSAHGDTWGACLATHEGWVGANLDKVESWPA